MREGSDAQSRVVVVAPGSREMGKGRGDSKQSLIRGNMCIK